MSYLGTIGESLAVQGKVAFRTVFESAWGPRTIIKVDVAGDAVVWFATGVKHVFEGDEITLAGKVKKHDVYRDRHGRYPPQEQTILTRCKMEIICQA